MIEVFSTNVLESTQASELVSLLQHYYPLSKINFDLEDCDNILRVEGEDICHRKITDIVTMQGYQCRVLE